MLNWFNYVESLISVSLFELELEFELALELIIRLKVLFPKFAQLNHLSNVSFKITN